MKKGFTLMELLAIIVLLAVILVIAVPRIMDVMSESKQNAFDSSAKTVYKSLENKVNAYILGADSTDLTASTAFAQDCPSNYWNTSNGVCKYTYVPATGVSSLQVRLSNATGKFSGASNVVFDGITITHP